MAATADRLKARPAGAFRPCGACMGVRECSQSHRLSRPRRAPAAHQSPAAKRCGKPIGSSSRLHAQSGLLSRRHRGAWRASCQSRDRSRSSGRQPRKGRDCGCPRAGWRPSLRACRDDFRGRAAMRAVGFVGSGRGTFAALLRRRAGGCAGRWRSARTRKLPVSVRPEKGVGRCIRRRHGNQCAPSVPATTAARRDPIGGSRRGLLRRVSERATPSRRAYPLARARSKAAKPSPAACTSTSTTSTPEARPVGIPRFASGQRRHHEVTRLGQIEASWKPWVVSGCLLPGPQGNTGIPDRASMTAAVRVCEARKAETAAGLHAVGCWVGRP